MPKTNLFRETPFAQAMREEPVYLIDVGSRHGIDPDLLPIAFAVEAIGFEPDEVECAKLNCSAPNHWKSVGFIPCALAGETGEKPIFICEDPISNSLLQPDAEFAARFSNSAYATVVERATVPAYNFPDAINQFNIPQPDFIKLDVEGLELNILKSGPDIINGAVAIKTEVAFPRIRQDQPPAHELDAYLLSRGYELIDIIDPTVWRRHGYVVHPMLSRAPMSYSKGQIIQCDFLYMRHPDKFSTEFSVSSDVVKQKLKAAWIAMSYGYFDRAEDYISDPIVEEFLRDLWKLDWTKDLYDASVKFGKLARKKAINAQLRGLLTFLHNVIRPFPGT